MREGFFLVFQIKGMLTKGQINAIREMIEMPDIERKKIFDNGVIPPHVVECHPQFFDMFRRREMEPDVLRSILNNLERVAGGGNIHDASVGVGKMLADKFLPKDE